MWPDRVSTPGPLTYESGALPTALRAAQRTSEWILTKLVQILGKNLLTFGNPDPIFKVSGGSRMLENDCLLKECINFDQFC